MFKAFRSKYETMDDDRLLENYRKNRELEILGVLCHRYMHLVYGLCLKYLKDPEESKDAVMQIFEKLTTSIPKHEIKHFKSWLYVVSKNHCLGVLKREKLRANVEQVFMESEDFMTLNGKGYPDHQDMIDKAMDSLPEPQRLCIQLFYYEKHSYKQISETTGYHLNKVKSHIQNGKRNLKIYLDGHER